MRRGDARLLLQPCAFLCQNGRASRSSILRRADSTGASTLIVSASTASAPTASASTVSASIALALTASAGINLPRRLGRGRLGRGRLGLGRLGRRLGFNWGLGADHRRRRRAGHHQRRRRSAVWWRRLRGRLRHPQAYLRSRRQICWRATKPTMLIEAGARAIARPRAGAFE
jgi:hypothetical protein